MNKKIKKNKKQPKVLNLSALRYSSMFLWTISVPSALVGKKGLGNPLSIIYYIYVAPITLVLYLGQRFPKVCFIISQNISWGHNVLQ